MNTVTLMNTATAIRTDAVSRTSIAVHLSAGGGPVRVDADASADGGSPRVRPMLLRSDTRAAWISLVGEGALLLAGDAVAIDVEVGPGARLHIQEVAGTVAYPMHGGSASWRVRITVADGGFLAWEGQPCVVSKGADVVRSTTITAGSGARVGLSESLVFGRHGEPTGRLRTRLDARLADGTAVLTEQLDVDESSNRLLLAGAKAMTTVLTLGARIEPAALPGHVTHLDLHECGSVVRGLSAHAHAAVPDQVARAIWSWT
jgi:urease accessory protein